MVYEIFRVSWIKWLHRRNHATIESHKDQNADHMLKQILLFHTKRKQLCGIIYGLVNHLRIKRYYANIDKVLVIFRTDQ